MKRRKWKKACVVFNHKGVDWNYSKEFIFDSKKNVLDEFNEANRDYKGEIIICDIKSIVITDIY